MVYKTPKDVQERKDHKRRHLLDTASRVFAVQGYHAASVKDIVEEAGLSVGSFYFYFKNKEEIFETLYDEMIHRLIESVDKAVYNLDINAVERVCRAIFSALWIIENNRELSKIMMIEAVGLNPRLESKRQESNKKLLMMVKKSLESASKCGDVDFPDLDIAALCYTGSVFNVITDWLQDNPAARKLTDSAYPLALFILQAIGMEFQSAKVKDSIHEIASLFQSQKGGKPYVE